jgi:hypothetical protein
MQADRLTARTVQTYRVACVLDGTEGVAAGLVLPARGAEHQRVPVDEPQVPLGLPGTVRVQLAFQRGQERNGRATAGGLRRDAVAVGAELPGDRDRLRVEVPRLPR